MLVSKLILRRPTVRLNALTVVGLLRAAKGSSFSNTFLLIIREGKSDRRAANRVLLVGGRRPSVPLCWGDQGRGGRDRLFLLG
jgi:hypothetical protein